MLVTYGYATSDVRYFTFYVYGSVQRDATQSSLFIILQVHCTYFGCLPHPSSGHTKL